MEKSKEDCLRLRASNENQIYINEKLNKALAKLMGEKKNKKDSKTKKEQVTEEGPLTSRKECQGTTGGSQVSKEEQKTELKSSDQVQEKSDEGFGGDISSIMITPMEANAIQGNQYDDFMEESVQYNKQ